MGFALTPEVNSSWAKVEWRCRGNHRQGFNWLKIVHERRDSGLEPNFCDKLPIRDGARRRDFKFRNLGEVKRHVTGVTLGCPGFLDVCESASRTDGHTMEAGYRKRLNPSMPTAKPDLIALLKVFTRRFCKKHLTPLLPWDEEETLAHFKEWLDGYDDNATRKSLLESLFKAQERIPVGKLTKCKSFVKSEFYPEKKLPRYINSRTDEFKVRVAAWVHAIEKEVFGGSLRSWFVKGLDRSQFPERLKRLAFALVYLQTDYASFESGFNPAYVDAVECELWRYMLQNNPDALDDFLLPYWQKDGSGRIIPRAQEIVNKSYRAKITGTRMSGEMWTSLGNGFSNLINVFFNLWLKGIYPDSMPALDDFFIKGVVEGDDGLIALPSKLFEKEDFEDLGFKIDMKYLTRLEDCSFCSVHFDLDTDRMYLEPENIIRFNWTCDSKYFNTGNRVRLELLRAKAMSLYVLGKHTPIANRLALKVIKLTEKVKARYSNDWWERQKQVEVKRTIFEDVVCTERDRINWFRMFGISVSAQYAIEEQIDAATCVEDLDFAFKLCDKCNAVGFYGGVEQPL